MIGDWRKIDRGLFESADGCWRIANPWKLTTELRHRWLVAQRRPEGTGWNMHDGDHATLHEACVYVDGLTGAATAERDERRAASGAGAMSVYKRPSGKWAAQVYDPATRTRRQVGTFATKREARRAESAAMGQQMATGRETVGSFAARWPVDYPRPRASTNVHNAGSVIAFARAYDQRRMDSITMQEARAWALRHPAQVMALRAMFNDGRRSGMVVSNPFKELGIERSRGRRDLPSEWLTATDVERLAQCAREVHGAGGYGDTIAGLLVFAAYTGLRPGELYALRHDDLGTETVEVRRAADSHTRTLTLPKNGRARVVVYPEQAREAVERAPRLSGVELVFPAPRGGQLWASSFLWVWNPVRAAFGRPKMALHELRHFCATYLLELGLAPVDVAVQLGHTDGGSLVMSTYGHPSERAARARIAAAMNGHRSGELRSLRGGGGL